MKLPTVLVGIAIVLAICYLTLVVVPGRKFRFYTSPIQSPRKKQIIIEDGFRVEYLRTQPIFKSECTFGLYSESSTYNKQNLVESPGTFNLFGRAVEIGFYRFSTDRVFVEETPKKRTSSFWQRRWIGPSKTVLVLILETENFRSGLILNQRTGQWSPYETRYSNRKRTILLQVSDTEENLKLILDPKSSLNRNRVIHVGEADQKN